MHSHSEPEPIYMRIMICTFLSIPSLPPLTLDHSGPAAHGDYVFGWKDDSLQKAMNSGCNLNVDCPAAGLHAQQPAQYNACKKEQQAPEDVDGWLAEMPMGQMAIKA